MRSTGSQIFCQIGPNSSNRSVLYPQGLCHSFEGCALTVFQYQSALVFQLQERPSSRQGLVVQRLAPVGERWRDLSGHSVLSSSVGCSFLRKMLRGAQLHIILSSAPNQAHPWAFTGRGAPSQGLKVGSFLTLRNELSEKAHKLTKQKT